MSSSFRPVKTEWGPHSPNFLSNEMVERVICTLAEAWTGVCPDLDVVRDATEVFIKDGAAFLRQLYGSSLETLVACVKDEADLGISGGLGEQDLRCLLNNMSSLALEWNKWLDSHGGLTFLID